MSDHTWEDPTLADLYPQSEADIPERFRPTPERHPARSLIGGELVVAEGDERLPVYSRIALRTGSGLQPVLLGYTPRAGAASARRAVERARWAWEEGASVWRQAPWSVRTEAVAAFARELEALTDEIATLLCWEIGKPWSDARKEVQRSVQYMHDTLRELEALLQDRARVYRGHDGKLEHFARDELRPSGIALCVGPFNYPVNEFLTTMVPALLMGNPVIAKIPRFGVLANQVLLEAFARCFPAGVLSVLPGDGKEVIPEVMGARGLDVFGREVPMVRTLAFIGSEGAANAIVSKHPAPNFLTRVLGLGAKNPAILLPGVTLSDPDLERIVKGSLGNNGQRCTAEKLLFLPEGPEGDLLAERLVAQVDALVPGMPWTDGVSITPLPEEGKPQAMQEMLRDALSKGARLLTGGRSFGSLMRPAVIDGVTDGMRLDHEEQFGPILAIRRYRDPRELLAWAVRSPYGQQVALWGPGKDALLPGLVDEYARVNLDDVCQRGPDSFGFTATEKSGYGTLSLREALAAFSRTTIVQSPTSLEVTRS
jgi:glyceraldehyde-3-phosphate dehydrogenase (NADP+)